VVLAAKFKTVPSPILILLQAFPYGGLSYCQIYFFLRAKTGKMNEL
jgi:hypothetical protein